MLQSGWLYFRQITRQKSTSALNLCSLACRMSPGQIAQPSGMATSSRPCWLSHSKVTCCFLCLKETWRIFGWAAEKETLCWIHIGRLGLSLHREFALKRKSRYSQLCLNTVIRVQTFINSKALEICGAENQSPISIQLTLFSKDDHFRDLAHIHTHVCMYAHTHTLFDLWRKEKYRNMYVCVCILFL